MTELSVAVLVSVDARDRFADRRLEKPWDRKRLLSTVCDLCLIERT